jgi:hypothetical protein
VARVEEVFNPLARSERELMLLAEGAHRVNGLAPLFLFMIDQQRILLSDDLESTFYDFFGRSAESASERGLDNLGAMRGEVHLHGKENSTPGGGPITRRPEHVE